MRNITDEQFYEIYMPIEDGENGIVDFDYRVTNDIETFETAIKARTLWTEVEGEDDCTYLLNGFHHVNRLRHFITKVPYQEGEDYNADYEFGK